MNAYVYTKTDLLRIVSLAWGFVEGTVRNQKQAEGDRCEVRLVKGYEGGSSGGL